MNLEAQLTFSFLLALISEALPEYKQELEQIEIRKLTFAIQIKKEELGRASKKKKKLIGRF